MAQSPSPAHTPSGEHAPAEYHRGEMSVKDHRSMYMRFNGMIHWGSTLVAALVAFLVLWLCAHIPFIAAVIVSAVIIGVGVWMNRNTGHNAGY